MFVVAYLWNGRYLDEQDIGAMIIANGLALDCPKFSGGRYTEYAVVGVAASYEAAGVLSA